VSKASSGGQTVKMKIRQGLFKYGWILMRSFVLLGISYYILYPLVQKISVSFMKRQDLYDITVLLIPRHFTVDNYKNVFKAMDYMNSFAQTAFVTIITVLTQLVSCTMVGYGFARFKMPLKKFLFAMVIVTLIVPPQTIIVPMYLNFSFFDVLGIFKLVTGKTLSLTNTPWPFVISGLTCMGFKNGLYIFIIRQYFRNIPKELEEAALIDGSGALRTFVSVMLPSARPVLLVIAMFSGVWQWTDVFYSSWFMRGSDLLSRKLDSLAATIAFVEDGKGVPVLEPNYSFLLNSTGCILIILPLIILFLLAQRQFVEGIEQSGIVG